MDRARVTVGGRLSLPAEVRRRHGLLDGGEPGRSTASRPGEAVKLSPFHRRCRSGGFRGYEYIPFVGAKAGARASSPHCFRTSDRGSGSKKGRAGSPRSADCLRYGGLPVKNSKARAPALQTPPHARSASWTVIPKRTLGTMHEAITRAQTISSQLLSGQPVSVDDFLAERAREEEADY